MKLLLKRLNKLTEGLLFIDGLLFCGTLEYPWRDLSRQQKVPGETCIPAGTYPVVIDHSARFQKTMPHVLNQSRNQSIYQSISHSIIQSLSHSLHSGMILYSILATSGSSGRPKETCNSSYSPISFGQKRSSQFPGLELGAQVIIKDQLTVSAGGRYLDGIYGKVRLGWLFK
jgi:hypothetical protein